jgi:hypothetical protein
MLAIAPASCHVPVIIQLIKNVSEVATIRQLKVLARLRLYVAIGFLLVSVV